MDMATVQDLVQAHGLWLLAPITVLEGPVVTVIAAYLASLGLLNVYAVYVICVLGDLVGDTLMYGLGRYGPRILPARWQLRMGMTKSRRLGLRDHFRDGGGRTLILAKITHSAGFAALLAAGAGRMPLGYFLWYNLLGTLPKTLAFVVVGYSFGYAYATIDNYLFRGSLVVLVALAVALGVWIWRRKSSTSMEPAE